MTDLKESLRKSFKKGYLKKKFGKMMDMVPSPGDGTFLLPAIDPNIALEAGQKLALFITPFYGLDASSAYNDFILNDLKKNGFIIHTVVYGNTPLLSPSPFWDYTTYLKPQCGNFGETRAQPPFDRQDGIDDWAGDDLLMYISALVGIYEYDLCICNYVFLSRSLTVQRPNTQNILLTIDVFANRNERILKAGGSEMSFYFSTDVDEERKGLSRADLIVAIQDKEQELFVEISPETPVVTLPYCPDPIEIDPPQNEMFTIGFLASAHYPNVEALRNFIDAYEPATSASKLLVAGSVCKPLSKDKLPEFVTLAGIISDINEFYSQCDIIINPDMLESGLKIKCIEALSMGVPLICTKPASTGIGLVSPYHLAESAGDVAQWCNKASDDATLRKSMAQESRRAYAALKQRYNVSNILEPVLQKKPSKH